MYRNKIYYVSFLVIFCVMPFFFGCKKKDLPMKMNDPHNIKGVVSYKRTFSDLNNAHLEAAKRIGIRPVSSREEAERLSGRLEKVDSCEVFDVDSLTHSVPYLVPRAHEVLTNIGQSFLDSLANKGLNPNKIIVTSVLRTKEDVKKLSRRNVNASQNSAHSYGTTFDISYKRFCKVEDPDGYPTQDVGADTLKLVLAEVLRDFRKAEECYVKYELKQGCFHITARSKK